MKIIRLISVVILLVMLLCLCSCNSLKVTPEMQTAIDIYINAVKLSAAKTSGAVNVTSVLNDSAIEFKTSESVIDFTYKVEEGKVIYNRTDTLDGKEVAIYECDGTSVKVFDPDTGNWEDKTEQNKDFLSSATNPLISLSLFRVDNNFKVRTDYMTDIKSYSEDGCSVIEFVLDDSTVTDILKYNKADGIVRQSAGHVRKYYISDDGYIEKIVVSTVQLLYSNGEEGVYSSEMTVTCK